MVEVRSESFPERRLEKKNGSYDEKAELEARLPELKAIDGEDDEGGGEEIIDDGRASQQEEAAQYE